MAERYFKKSKSRFTVGYSDKVFKYIRGLHKIESLEERFEECDAKGKNIIKAIKKETSKPTKKKVGK